MTKDEFTFEINIPLNEESRKVIEEMANPDEFTLYAEKGKEMMPIANCRRHPDCDPKVFAEIMKKMIED